MNKSINSEEEQLHTPKKKTPEKPHKSFPIVGIGASAGGIEAITALLENLSPENGMAYVIIQHLAPHHESILPEIFERKTSMPVHRVESGMEIFADNVYVIPPDTYMSIVDGHLTLSPRGKPSGFYHPIDHFLISLASVYQNLAIGVILSGTATDGTAGLKSIKAEGGITFAQDDSAKFRSMPHSAIESGQVDFIFSPERIAKELSTIAKLPYVSNTENELLKQNEAELRNIFAILYNKRDVDFSMYKKTTIYRRILRRAALHRLKKIEDYTDMLRANDAEVGLLYNDLLINVTSFFRDPNVFNALSKKVLPALAKNRRAGDTIRIWVTACSTGEEAYSIAICLFEYIHSKSLNITFQIFATDLNELAIEKARAGMYLKSALQNVSLSRKKNYFVKTEGGFQIIKAIRDVCVFAPHNLLSDPPFSRIDIISCQNVLIYLEAASQNKILQAFHYALKPEGFLMLGKSESIGESLDLFDQADKADKLFTKKEGVHHRPFDFSMRSHKVFKLEDKKSEREMPPASTETAIEKEADKLLLSRYVPASVLVNKDMQIIRFNGPISEYLQPTGGKASLNLLKMVRDEFLFDLRSLINRVRKTGQPVKKEGIQFGSNGSLAQVALEVILIKSASTEPYYLILFKGENHKINIGDIKSGSANHRNQQGKDEKIIKLETELGEAIHQMKSVSEEFEAAREELQSSNEEVLSSNEELQSINEELETSKEELQSSNEELITINEELNYRNIELKEAFEYRDAIVETIHEPLVVLNADLRIITANRAFYNIFKISRDETEGNYFHEIAHGQWNITSLKKQLNEIITSNKSFENFEIPSVSTEQGERIILFNAMRMGNESSKKNRILLVIEDITERRKAEEDLKKSHELNLRILNSISDIFISIDNSWKYTFINKSAEHFIGKKAKDVLGRNIWEVLPAYAGTGFYVQLIQAMKTKQFSQFEFFDESSKRWFNYRLYPAKDALSIYANDVTEQKLSVDLINQSKERYQTFISKNAEGIWRFEIQKPISVKFSKDVQIRQLLKNAFLAECNDSIAKMYGYTRAEDIIGNSLEEMLSSAESKNYLSEFISSGYFLTDAEIHEVDKDGTEKYFLNNLVGIIEKGAIKRIWGTQRDITEHKQSEISLKATQQKLSLALSVGSVATWVWDIHSNFIEWPGEQQNLYGLQECPDNCRFENWIKLIHADDVIEVQKHIKNAIAEHRDTNVEFRVNWPDESLHWLLLKASTTYDERGKPLQMAGVNIDITSRKALEKQKEEFIVIASHELKTPVTSIKAYAEILNEILLNNNDISSAAIAKKMDSQVDRLNNLIKDLLDVTKINEGQLKLKQAYFDFNALIDEVAEDMQNTTLKHTIIKEVNVNQQIWGDKDKIREVLINLVSNAIKYSPESNKIIITASTDDRVLTASVKDFGIGITKKNREKLFQRFFRVNDSTVNTFPGLGLGLYISHEIIKKHNGTIWVASTKDEGSEFYFTLPLVKT